MVITGGNFSPDILKAKEVMSLLLDDDEMERKRTYDTSRLRIFIACDQLDQSEITWQRQTIESKPWVNSTTIQWPQ